MQVAKDMVVSMHYTLALENGSVLGSSADREPLQFICGHGMIIPGLEKELIGLKTGDRKKVTVQPQDGYGFVNDQLIQTVNRDQLPPNLELEKGMFLTGQNEQGQQFDVKVKSFNDTEVVIDMNHPLAGEVLHFETEIVDLRKASPGELDHGHIH